MEALAKVLADGNVVSTVVLIAAATVSLLTLAKSGLLKFKGKGLTIGDGTESVDAYYERTIMRNQIASAHMYISSLENEILDRTNGDPIYGGFHVKYALELVFDKVVEWITFNHVEDSEAYVSCKQDEVLALIHSLYLGEKLKTKDFDEQMKQWTVETIRRIVKVRKLYQRQKEEKTRYLEGKK